MTTEGQVTFDEPVPGVGVIQAASLGSTNNIYALGAKDGYLLLDAGTAPQAAGFIRVLEAQGYRSGKGIALVLTHGHADHYGGAAELSAWAGAPIWAHPAAATEMEDRWGVFTSLDAILQRHRAEAWPEFQAAGGKEVPVQRFLRGGDTLSAPGLGGLDVLHGPGHQRGELIIFHRTQRLAFVGDIIQGGFDAAGNWIGLIPDPERQRQTLARLRELAPRWLFKGHRCPRCGDEAIRDIDAALSRLDRIEAALLEVLQSRRDLDTAEACRRVFRDVLNQTIDEPQPYAIITVEAFLSMLARRGLVSRNANLHWTIRAV